MQAVLDILENVTGGIRLLAGILALVIMGGTLFMSFGASYVASNAVDEIVAETEALGKVAIKAQRDAEREQAMAQEGWGYELSHNSDQNGFGEEDLPNRKRSSRRDEVDDWGVQD